MKSFFPDFAIFLMALFLCSSRAYGQSEKPVSKTSLENNEFYQERQEELKRVKQDSLDGFYIPRDIEDCMLELDRMLTLEEKNTFLKSMPWQLHEGLGWYLRNNWGLWGGSRLKEYFTTFGITHPDNMSSIILNSYWMHLTNKPIDLEKQIERYPRTPQPTLMLPAGSNEKSP